MEDSLLISWLLVTLNLLLFIIPALVLHTVVVRNRRQAGEHLLEDLRSGGMLVHELPKQCSPVESRLHEQRLIRARWNVSLLTGENPLWLYQESGLGGRLVCTWRSKSKYPLHLVITANGGLAKRSSPELFPRRGRGWRQKRGFNRVKAWFADNVGRKHVYLFFMQKIMLFIRKAITASSKALAGRRSKTFPLKRKEKIPPLRLPVRLLTKQSATRYPRMYGQL